MPGGEQLGSGSLRPRPGTRGWYAPMRVNLGLNEVVRVSRF